MTERATSWLASVVKLRCPRCRTGRLFYTSSLGFSRPFDMPRDCPACGQDFWPEPGFYYGAMFMSYIVFSFPCLGLVFFLHWVLDWSTGASMATLIAISAVGFIYVFRVSRSLWIHMNVRYDEVAADRVTAEQLAAGKAFGGKAASRPKS